MGPWTRLTVVRNWIDAYNRSDWELDLALLAPNAATEVIAREEVSTDPVESQAAPAPSRRRSPTSTSRSTT